MEINIGDYVRFKDYNYLKKHYPDRFHWRMYELWGREAKIIGVHPDGSFIVDIDKTFPVSRDMFTKLSEREVAFIKAFHLKH